MQRTRMAAAALGAIAAVGAILLVAFAAPAIDEIPVTYIPSGESMYKQYCAACHGSDATGDGPAAFTLKTPPADLTTLTVRNMGIFPRAYVENILRFGPGLKAHGSSEMPTWGSIFQLIENNNENAVSQRIKNLTDYIASLQKK
jgi:mono/diheme cytochrome c family protein